jgi:hypothetical protein
MEAKFGDYTISFSGLAPWKRFMLLIAATIGTFHIASISGVPEVYISRAWDLVLVGWTFYFVTHQGEPAATVDTTPESPDPDNGAAKEKAAPEKSKTAWEQEIAFGSGEYLNRKPLKL